MVDQQSEKTGEAVTRCIGIECSARKLRNIVHFASKAGMDIDGLRICYNRAISK